MYAVIQFLLFAAIETKKTYIFINLLTTFYCAFCKKLTRIPAGFVFFSKLYYRA
jgi:hypothetical protein